MFDFMFFETNPVAAPDALKGVVATNNIDTITNAFTGLGFIEIYAKCNISGVPMTHIKDNQVSVIEDHIKLSGEQINKSLKNVAWECVVLDKDSTLFYLRPILDKPLIGNNTKGNTSYLLCADTIGLIATLNGLHGMGVKIKSKILHTYSIKLFQHIELEALNLMESWQEDDDNIPVPDDILNAYHFSSVMEGWPNLK